MGVSIDHHVTMLFTSPLHAKKVYAIIQRNIDDYKTCSFLMDNNHIDEISYDEQSVTMCSNNYGWILDSTEEGFGNIGLRIFNLTGVSPYCIVEKAFECQAHNRSFVSTTFYAGDGSRGEEEEAEEDEYEQRLDFDDVFVSAYPEALDLIYDLFIKKAKELVQKT